MHAHTRTHTYSHTYTRHDVRCRAVARRRRGFVLLVVLTLLSLFVVIGTTFLLVASQYMRAARSQGQEELLGDPPQKLMDAAIYQVIRGTRDPNSNLATGDLLSDLYGYDGFVAYAAVVNVSGNTITLHVPVPEVVPSDPFPYGAPMSNSVSDYVFWRRIDNRQAAYFPLTLPTPLPSTPTLQAPWIYGYYVGQQLTFIDVMLNPNQPGVMPPRSLRHNTVPILSYARRTLLSAPAPFNDLPLNSNNEYEYAEITVTWPNNGYQTPSLSAMFGNTTNAVVQILVNGRPYNGIAGDLRYPDESYDAADDENLFLADPIDLTQPSYRGLGPPIANLANTSVDTDGDGTRDGRWLDIGLPLQTGRNGRQIRPLVSIRCIDMDGRINLNFAGSNSHLTTPNTWTIIDSGGAPRYRQSRGNTATDPMFSNTYQFTSYGQGSGIGPGDITLFDLLSTATSNAFPAATNSTVESIAQSWYAQLMAARYGTGASPGIVGDETLVVNSPPEVKFRPYMASSSYLDFHSALRYGMDPRGMPTMEPPYQGGPLIDSPYDLHADALRGYAPNARDHLFALTELERLLRYHDWDSNAIPSRLRTALFDIDGDSVVDQLNIGDMPGFRNSVTTESWDLGLLKIRAMRTRPAYLGGPFDRVVSFPELAYDRVDPSLSGPPLVQLMENLVTTGTLAPELVYGMPLDLNRQLTQLNLANPSDYIDRQLLARQLYVLMLIVGNVQNQTDYARIAQWAINVVDYRDQDSVMTPFEYDTNPFNGWDVDSDLTTTNETAERAVVWGCERPELLINEAFAWHDLRVNRTGMTYQQPFRPRGAAFVELYNPWASAHYGSDLNRWGTNFNSGVPLTQTAPVAVGQTRGAPVWRLEFRRVVDSETRYVYFTNPMESGAPVPVNRTYFSNVTTNPLFLMPGQYGVVGGVGWPVDPAANGFNSDIDNDGALDFVNTIGFPVGTNVPPLPDYANARRIQMSFGPNGQTYLRHVDGFDSLPMPVVACVINQVIDGPNSNTWRSLNISEPLAGYPVLPVNAGDEMEEKYLTPGSSPFDEGVHINSGTIENADPLYAVVRLQRLANPYLAYETTLNPYHTVDEFNNITLTRFNGNSTDPISPDGMDAFERSRVLWSSRNPLVSARTMPQNGGSHYFSRVLRTTLGQLNSNAGTPETTPLPQGQAGAPAGLPPDYYVGSPTTGPFPWLTWLNRPFRSQYELTDVPATSSEELLREYQSPATYTGGPTHLLPLIDYRASGGQNTNNLYYHILHYTRTRSPFLGTENYVGGGVLPKREPGRVNINTVPTEAVWNSLWNGIDWNGTDTPQAGDSIASSWIPMLNSTIVPLRQTTPFQTPLLTDGVDQDPWIWLFANGGAPRRWPSSNNGMTHMDGGFHSAYRFHGLNRLGGSVTTTSNVFAIWITVGYFEMDQSGAYNGIEYNAGTGEQRRHRAFYIVDRSIPVAYEPGESHNVDRLILLRRMIE